MSDSCKEVIGHDHVQETISAVMEQNGLSRLPEAQHLWGGGTHREEEDGNEGEAVQEKVHGCAELWGCENGQEDEQIAQKSEHIEPETGQRTPFPG